MVVPIFFVHWTIMTYATKSTKFLTFQVGETRIVKTNIFFVNLLSAHPFLNVSLFVSVYKRKAGKWVVRVLDKIRRVERSELYKNSHLHHLVADSDCKYT